MIVGPGNLFVALAKKHVFGQVAIDCLAGPSEIVVAADDSAHPDYVALDLIAQAEHSPGRRDPGDLVRAAARRGARGAAEAARRSCPRRTWPATAWSGTGRSCWPRTRQAAIECVNELAPEHLHIQTRDPEAFADEIDNAGAIFLGPFTPVALGDYAAGPSHVLPTGGTARFASGLTANDFRKRTSIMRFTRNGLQEIADDVIFLANKEGLTGPRRERRAAGQRQRPRRPAQAEARQGRRPPRREEVNRMRA